MKKQLLAFCAALIVPATASADQVTEIQEHLQSVETHLRTTDVSHWPEAKQAARQQTLDYLTEYRLAGQFPENVDFEADRVPYFFDNRGTACAVAHLMVETGHEADALAISERENNAWVMEMVSPEVGPWLEASGLTAEEASWIQPTYGFCDTIVAEVESVPELAKCGDTIQFVAVQVPEESCGANYYWEQVAEEPTVEFIDGQQGRTVDLILPDSTMDGESLDFALSVSNQGFNDRKAFSVLVECEGSATPDPGDGSGTKNEPSTCSAVGANGLPASLILLALFGLVRRRRNLLD